MTPLAWILVGFAAAFPVSAAALLVVMHPRLRPPSLFVLAGGTLYVAATTSSTAVLVSCLTFALVILLPLALAIRTEDYGHRHEVDA